MSTNVVVSWWPKNDLLTSIWPGWNASEHHIRPLTSEDFFRPLSTLIRWEPAKWISTSRQLCVTAKTLASPSSQQKQLANLKPYQLHLRMALLKQHRVLTMTIKLGLSQWQKATIGINSSWEIHVQKLKTKGLQMDHQPLGALFLNYLSIMQNFPVYEKLTTVEPQLTRYTKAIILFIIHHWEQLTFVNQLEARVQFFYYHLPWWVKRNTKDSFRFFKRSAFWALIELF